LLSAIGIFSVISYAMHQRVQEIGIRMALGAQRSQVIWMVLRESMRITGIGVVLGIAASLGATRLLAALLFHVSPGDPLTLAGVVVVLSVVAISATYFPARRASNAEPMQALRSE
jgi:ABC-type antimicrobial peptide transport system permease subunit